jgi:hypothetical protein
VHTKKPAIEVVPTNIDLALNIESIAPGTMLKIKEPSN